MSKMQSLRRALAKMLYPSIFIDCDNAAKLYITSERRLARERGQEFIFMSDRKLAERMADYVKRS
jgi:hypothetical protein